jgi:GNAT superfamily N-acetyltransferase
MSGWEIVRAEEPDLDLVAPLFDAYRRFYEQPGDLEGARRFIAERFAALDAVIFLALESGDAETIRGLGFVQLFPSFSSVSMKRLWILNDLYVAEVARGRGVGRALMNRARDLAIDTGAKGLVLETGADNHAARRLYEDLGYRIDGTRHYELIV